MLVLQSCCFLVYTTLSQLSSAEGVESQELLFLLGDGQKRLHLMANRLSYLCQVSSCVLVPYSRGMFSFF
jgi:hypothetical protein